MYQGQKNDDSIINNGMLTKKKRIQRVLLAFINYIPSENA
jgi:hypothetical protein